MPARSFVLTAAMALFCLASRAQNTSQEEIAIPESYMEEQNIVQDQNPGVASYNIDGTETATEMDGSAETGSYSNYEQQTETIHIYSGKQEGNNVVKTVQVPLPDGSGNFSYREYQPH